MHHLLESLPEKYNKKVKELIKLTELTAFSVMVNRDIALVGTNKKLIVCRKRLFFFYEVKWEEWSDISSFSCDYKDKDATITLQTKKDTWQIHLSSDKIYLLRELEEKINSMIEKEK